VGSLTPMLGDNKNIGSLTPMLGDKKVHAFYSLWSVFSKVSGSSIASQLLCAWFCRLSLFLSSLFDDNISAQYGIRSGFLELSQV
jgi:hypothetical protein